MKQYPIQLYTRDEVAEMLSVDIRTVDRYIGDGLKGKKLKVCRIGGNGSPRIELEDIYEFMNIQPPAEVDLQPRQMTEKEMIQRAIDLTTR